MTFETFLPLAIFTLVSTITPGGATTLAAASGAHFGYRRSLPMIGGIAVGLATMAAAAAVGLGGLLLAIPALQLVMKMVGTLYLLWLAIQIARSPGPRAASGSVRPVRFIGGVWTLWHNPKAWAMSVGAAASFAGLMPGPTTLAILFGTTFLIVATLSLSLWCMAGQMLGRILRSDRQWRLLNMLLGGILFLSIIPMWAE